MSLTREEHYDIMFSLISVLVLIATILGIVVLLGSESNCTIIFESVFRVIFQKRRRSSLIETDVGR